MKIAILITAYKDFGHISDIIDCFDSRFNFYIHIDKKSKENFSMLTNRPNVHLYRKYTVHWGSINHLKAALWLATEAIEHEDNIYFHLISGQDFPVRPVSDFIQLDFSHDYLSSFPLPYLPWSPEGGMERYTYYHLYDLLDPKKPFQNTLIQFVYQLQRRLGVKRKLDIPELAALYGGGLYWSLSRLTLSYVLEYTRHHPAFLNRLRYTWCAEEIYFQTILLNSHYAESIKNTNLRYIDWKSGRGGYPAFLDESDYDAIKQSKALFARKFDARSQALKQQFQREHLLDKEKRLNNQ